MKTLKVSIQDENTLMLQEDGQKGDLIDLKSIHETDIDKTTISSVVKSIKMNEFNAQLQKELANVEKQKALEVIPTVTKKPELKEEKFNYESFLQG